MRTFRWSNRAGVSWPLTCDRIENDSLSVGSECPYFSDGHVRCKVERARGRIVALFGPWGERYDRCSDADQHDEEEAAATRHQRQNAQHQAALHRPIPDSVKQKYGHPCFTWELGPPDDGSNIPDCLMDRVGGPTGFAQYKDLANSWPCHPNMFFVCQVNLAEIPEEMQNIVGNSGLLQIFQGDNTEIPMYNIYCTRSDQKRSKRKKKNSSPK